MKSYAKKLRLLAYVLILNLLVACGGGGGSSSVGTGSLATSLTDSSTEDYRAIYVTVERVEVSPDDATWQIVATPGGTYDLLSLVNGVRAELGITPLAAGHYNQLRLILGTVPDAMGTNILSNAHPFANYLIDQSDNELELKVPSGTNTGIKIVHGFDISENQTTELILDFDAMKSVVKAGSSGKYLLKPTIKVLSTVDSAIVTGLVSDGASGIEGALVSAQTYTNDLAVDVAQRVALTRSTVAAADDLATLDDETGEYLLDLPAGNYNMVAYFTGFEPVCETIDATIATPTIQDFSLSSAVTGTIAGTVNVIGAIEDQHVTIDFRQAGHCDDPNAVINVKTLEIADTGNYSVELPVGNYLLVASTSGFATQVSEVDISENTVIDRNIDF